MQPNGEEESSVNANMQMAQDQLIFLEALYEIAMSSESAEEVRIAMAALTRTQAGLTFLASKPITL